jgi:uncharacterized protein YigE (DUF2233 family)
MSSTSVLKKIFLVLFFFISVWMISYGQHKDPRFVVFVTDASAIRFYWKNEKGEILRSIANLKEHVGKTGHELRFAMNGGMYRKDNSPQGLYIENGRELSPLDTASGSGNFYLKPNGVFYISKNNEAGVSTTERFSGNDRITFATQSGPMLLIDGAIHPAFKKGSPNLNIRNGVGILPDGKVLFVMSKQEINFFDFASFFLDMGCRNALYLDGLVSRAYLPELDWVQVDGNFGVIVGVNR